MDLNKKIYPVCSECGSADVEIDAYATWDHKTQTLEVNQDFEKGGFCNICTEPTTIKWVEGDPPEEKEEDE